MSWKVEVLPSAEKKYRKLDRKTRSRIVEALRELEQLENPFIHPDVRTLTGELKGSWRMRVGDWRILFEPQGESRTLRVYAILPRGSAY
ncbi:MAG: type II toxin-antitoxin system RelE/ParE family toxin [Actinobacteria bacterium]|nr:type II toxin-antitoxin system RelE/ParE family toxin [Actinomycetota bacterium]MBU1945270.1 type II toxin-antitoxin system RelE/ParE family toxin [Actinomycetota bacterium]MBU2687842.1 type II toxin-antitoxin system RelE/ParE family toxin [Actinomycetota bacterium]